jgi:membrane-associated phospholipid phosphatase
MHRTPHRTLVGGGVALLMVGASMRSQTKQPETVLREPVPIVDDLMRVATQFGTKIGLLILLVMMLRHVRPLQRWLVHIVIPALGAVIVTDLLKPVFRDPRPVTTDDRWLHAAGFAFPSGHATAAGAVLALIVLHRHSLPTALTAILLVICAGSVLSRLWFGVHQVHDVIAGIGVGMAVTTAASAMAMRRHRVAGEP